MLVSGRTLTVQNSYPQVYWALKHVKLKSLSTLRLFEHVSGTPTRTRSSPLIIQQVTPQHLLHFEQEKLQLPLLLLAHQPLALVPAVVAEELLVVVQQDPLGLLPCQKLNERQRHPRSPTTPPALLKEW